MPYLIDTEGENSYTENRKSNSVGGAAIIGSVVVFLANSCMRPVIVTWEEAGLA